MGKKRLILFAVFLFLLGQTVTPLFADESTSITVLPRSANFQFNFDSSELATTFSQNHVLTYTITYGVLADENLPVNTVITVDYSHDTIDGTQNTAHLLDYIVASATNGYNDAAPVVDTVNRTITWTMPNVPAGTTNQTLSFQLITSSNYTGSNSIPMVLTATMSNQYLTLSPQTITQNYLFNPSLLPPTPTPTAAPITPTPTPAAPKPLHIAFVTLNSITDTTATIGILTTKPARIAFNYGTSPQNLFHTIASNSTSQYTLITLESLTPKANYYYRVLAVANNEHVSSDIFVLQTAKLSPPPKIPSATIIFTSLNNVLQAQNIQQATSNTLITPGTDYQITLAIGSNVLKQLAIVVRNSKVLAINTFSNEFEQIIPMVEKQPGIYSVDLKTFTTFGTYDIFARITDANGNIVEQKIGQVRVIPKLTILEKDTNTPVEGARVYLFHLDDKTKQFEPLNASYNIANPLSSLSDGTVPVLLPKGTYKVNVSAPLFEPASTTFVLGDKTQGFPIIQLRKNPIDIVALSTYYISTAGDFLGTTKTYIDSFASSLRLFDLFALLTSTFFVLTTFLLFLLRTHLSLKTLPHYVSHHIFSLFQSSRSLVGKVLTEGQKPVPQATVYIKNASTKSIIFETKTNTLGIFYTPQEIPALITIDVLKKGFVPISLTRAQLLDSNSTIVLPLEEHESLTVSFITTVAAFCARLLGLLFEVFLLLSLVIEGILSLHFGTATTLPFLMLSGLSIVLWIFYTKERVQQKL